MALEAKNIRISIAQRVLFDNLSLKVAAGHIYTLMGPSGSGKSTLLSFMLGALEKQIFNFSGSIFLSDLDISSFPIEKRNIGILFQDALLFPHINVEENLLFALPATIKGRKERQGHVQEALKNSNLPVDLSHRYPDTLSGGEAARISLIRSLLSKPKALLLDEPFSKLDEQNRKLFRDFVFQQIEQYSLPTIMVTHEMRDYEAMPKSIRSELFILS